MTNLIGTLNQQGQLTATINYPVLTLKGDTGEKGDQGEPGLNGGMSAYDVAVLNGYVGTEAEWLLSIVGPQGEQGIQGEDGPQGLPGVEAVSGPIPSASVYQAKTVYTSSIVRVLDNQLEFSLTQSVKVLILVSFESSTYQSLANNCEASFKLILDGVDIPLDLNQKIFSYNDYNSVSFQYMTSALSVGNHAVDLEMTKTAGALNVDPSIRRVSISVVAMQGAIGPTGPQGYTPIKGVDYFDGTDAVAGELPSAYIETSTKTTTASATLEDVPNMSTTITLDEAVNIAVMASFEIQTQAGGGQSTIAVAINIDGVDHDEVKRYLSGTTDTGIGAIVHRTSAPVAAGTHTIKFRYRKVSGTGTPGVNRADMLVMAMQGAMGVQGIPGNTPVKGVDYFDGIQGIPGYTPIKGTDYFDGEQGLPGLPGYTPIKGTDYFDGVDGQDGAPGLPGAKGDPGTTPVKGVDYFDGAPGSQGLPGQDGYTPIKGVDYFDGQDGTSFVILGMYETLLALETAHPTGLEGDAWAVGTPLSNVIYVWDTDLTDWNNLGSLAGPAGPQGIPGIDGQDGADSMVPGPQGLPGYTPIKGTDYFDGAPGTPGTNGTNGIDGLPGVAGAKIVSAGFDEADMVFTLDDASVVTITNAFVSLTGPAGADGINGYTAYNYTATLPSASWTGASAPYTKAVTVTGITSTDIPTIDIVPSGTYATDVTMGTNWAQVYRAVTTADTITFYAHIVPSADISLIVSGVR